MIPTIQSQRTDSTLIKRISLKRKIPLETVARMLRYNVMTPSQLATLTGKNENQIRGMSRYQPKKGSEMSSTLKEVPVFVEWDAQGGEEVDGKKTGEELRGRVFILRDENVEKLLTECNE